MRTALLLIAAFLTLGLTPNEDVETLRRGGQAAVDALHAETGGAPGARLDRVCAQKDCHASRLFWYTDLEEAKDAARALGRPILSLYLLGRLDEELSCANSRFFRVMLYSDPAIAGVLRDRYVLHWHSVRPVPIVTIDMGDGRTIRQTVTGNSVHYLLDADGRVLDALPGLHSPGAFKAQLEEWLTLDRAALLQYHANRAQGAGHRPTRNPQAIDAAVLAMSKVAVETPLLRQITLGARLPEIRTRPANEVVFSAPSLALMRTKQPLDETQLTRLRGLVALDTQLNDELHGVIHSWFAKGEVQDLQSLNERIYAELFLTPSSDPWLGLDPEAAFAALGE